jgi:hypothetical protein
MTFRDSLSWFCAAIVRRIRIWSTPNLRRRYGCVALVSDSRNKQRFRGFSHCAQMVGSPTARVTSRSLRTKRGWISREARWRLTGAGSAVNNPPAQDTPQPGGQYGVAIAPPADNPTYVSPAAYESGAFLVPSAALRPDHSSMVLAGPIRRQSSDRQPNEARPCSTVRTILLFCIYSEIGWYTVKFLVPLSVPCLYNQHLTRERPRRPLTTTPGRISLPFRPTAQVTCWYRLAQFDEIDVLPKNYGAL